MRWFDPRHRNKSPDHQRLYAVTELWYTVVDFGAAGSFVVGSILFFFDSTQIPATWLFLIGSILFAAKPTIRLWREVQFFRLGRYQRLAERAE
ncbi:hypothetical protein GCM10007989_27560 [Devosia pacifica]|uniref:YrhK domain-containing protein n=1 Tax=Devosia pacifica TaxID=1335967 RepID=A0A918S9V6_9HYPH|nr:YrhK family protein [Devosia pacifica]GHA30315.1 hypothetical protein GCM10007989_27560 [Devosia pacifica]